MHEKRKYRFLLALSFCFLGWIVPAHAQSNDYHQDLAIFVATLEKAHPGLNRYMAWGEWRRLVEDAFVKVDTTKTDRDFLKILYGLAQRIGDTHFQIEPNEEETTGEGYFPIPVLYQDGKLLVMEHARKTPLASEIVSINGIPTSDIMIRLAKFVFSDGLNYKALYEVASLRFDEFMYLEFGPHDTYEVHLILFGETDTTVAQIKGGSDTYLDEKYTNEMSETDIELTAYGSYPKSFEPQFELTDDEGVGLLTLRSFGLPPYLFYHQLKKEFRKINAEEITDLIIDVRDNPGGYTFNAVMLNAFITGKEEEWWDSSYVKVPYAPFAQYQHETSYRGSQVATLFAKGTKKGNLVAVGPQGHRIYPNLLQQNDYYYGRTYVLFNAHSYSSATLFAQFAKANPAIRTFGSESGSNASVQTAGFFAKYTLPFSKISYRFGLITTVAKDTWQSASSRGVKPDEDLPMTRENLYYDNDNQLEGVLGYIHQHAE